MDTAAFILAVITVIVEKGPAMLIRILNAWQIDDPSLEDIDKLHELVKKPEDYFD